MPLRRYSPFSRDFHQELAVTDSIEHDVCCRADNRRTAEGGCVRARRQDVAAGIRRDDSADRHAAAKTLRHGDNVRLDAVLLEGKQAAGAADAGLHLVDDEQHILLAAERLYCLLTKARGQAAGHRLRPG